MKINFTIKQQKKILKHFKAKVTPSKTEKEYYEKTYNYLKYIKWIPGLQMVAIGNSISMNSANENSDIDLFIVSTNNSMWFVRIIITIIFSILRVRKTDKKHASMFCLSFFATKSGLDFSSWKVENDIYLYFRIIYLKPVLDYNNTYSLFLEKNKSWMEFNGYEKIIDDNKNYIKFTKNKKEPGVIITKLNNILKYFFLPKTVKHYEMIGKPYGVIINDNLLKFHNGDIREKISKELT